MAQSENLANESVKILLEFVAGWFVVVAITLALVGGVLTSSFIKKESQRSSLAIVQLEQFFSFHYPSMAEEAWTQNYGAIAKRVEYIAKRFGKAYFNLIILDENKKCQYEAILRENDADLIETEKCGIPEASLASILSRLENSNVKCTFQESAYEVILNFQVAGIRRGWLIVRLSDPFGFFRGSPFTLMWNIAAPVIFLVLLLLGLWMWASKQLFLNPFIKKSVELEKTKELSKLASQVAHDIRSPLAALEMILPSINELPEDKRLIIRNSINRIRDIANSLLTNSRSNKLIAPEKSDVPQTNRRIESNFLSPLLDSIISEKRLQFRDQLKVSIDYNHSSETYGLFAKIDSNEFKRIISNIINNSVEALDNNSGKVTIKLDAIENIIQILISDNGVGIPKDIIPKLTVKGMSYGKKDGNGLGLFYAKETISSWGGELLIESINGKKQDNGTVVTIILPRDETPSWFVPKIKISSSQKVVVFDDDQTVHQIWNERFSISLEHVSSPEALRKYFGQNFSDLDDVLFLMDYEILGHSVTGIDLIEELGIEKQSILVTSRYEEPLILERCKRIGVKLIPKPMSGFVPIEKV